MQKVEDIVEGAARLATRYLALRKGPINISFLARALNMSHHEFRSLCLML